MVGSITISPLTKGAPLLSGSTTIVSGLSWLAPRNLVTGSPLSKLTEEIKWGPGSIGWDIIGWSSRKDASWSYTLWADPWRRIRSIEPVARIWIWNWSSLFPKNMRNLSSVVCVEVEVIVLPFSNSPEKSHSDKGMCEIESVDLDNIAIDKCLRDGSNGRRHRKITRGDQRRILKNFPF